LTLKRPKYGGISKTSNGTADYLQPSLLERQYLHKRIAEEYAQLKQLEKAASQANPSQGNERVEQMGELV
jgi:hypothetical protein